MQYFISLNFQPWARRAVGAGALRSLGPLSGQHSPVAQAEADEKACWHCPKCRCFCGSEIEMRRCGHRNFSCGQECRKVLSCGKHKCETACHEGDCPPCSKIAIHKCQCGQASALRACAESDFRCENPCDRQLSCQKHWCQRGCHSDPCGECLLTRKRSCPCEKIEHKGIPCDVVIPTCGSTCKKMLPCEIHRCSERCHFGPCKEVCRVVLTKICRCRSLKKEAPCQQELQCEKKCQRVRDCSRHACRRRCCDGNCPLRSECENGHHLCSACSKKISTSDKGCPGLGASLTEASRSKVLHSLVQPRITPRVRPLGNEVLGEIFRVLDRKSDGVLSAEDLRSVMETLGQALSEEDILAMVQTAKGSDNGTLRSKTFASL